MLYQANDVTIRQAGQEWVLLEFGEATIDVGARVLIGDFAKIVIDSALPGVVEMIPGVRSLLLRFDTHDGPTHHGASPRTTVGGGSD